MSFIHGIMPQGNFPPTSTWYGLPLYLQSPLVTVLIIHLSSQTIAICSSPSVQVIFFNAVQESGSSIPLCLRRQIIFLLSGLSGHFRRHRRLLCSFPLHWIGGTRGNFICAKSPIAMLVIVRPSSLERSFNCLSVWSNSKDFLTAVILLLFPSFVSSKRSCVGYICVKPGGPFSLSLGRGRRNIFGLLSKPGKETSGQAGHSQYSWPRHRAHTPWPI